LEKEKEIDMYGKTKKKKNKMKNAGPYKKKREIMTAKPAKKKKRKMKMY